MTRDKKIEIAEQLANKYKKTIKAEEVDENRDALFGVIVNTENQDGQTMVQKLGQDDAYHITNIVLQKLEQNVIGEF